VDNTGTYDRFPNVKRMGPQMERERAGDQDKPGCGKGKLKTQGGMHKGKIL